MAAVLWKISLQKATLIVSCVCGVVLFLIWQNASVMFDVREAKIGEFRGRLSPIIHSTETINSSKDHALEPEHDSISYDVHAPVTKSVKEIQNYRQQRMRRVCQKYYKIKPLNFEHDSSDEIEVVSHLHSRLNMTYFNDYFNFTIAIVFKVGSTSWRDIIINVHEFASWEYRKTHRNPLITLLTEFPKSPKEITKRLKNFTNFIFVRHPFSRLISAYTDKFVNFNTLTRDYYGNKARVILKTLRGAPQKDGTDPDVKFEEFIQFITDDHLFPNRMNKDGHWEPYVNTYKPCKHYFDFIGHMETLNGDLEYLSTLLKAEEFLNYPHKNPTKYSNKPTMKEYFSRLPDKLFKKLVNMYEDDFRIFGYDIPQGVEDL